MKIRSIRTGVLLIVIAVTTLSFYFYNQAQGLNKQVSELLKNPQQLAAEEVKRQTEEVGKVVSLPADETPTVATVVDPEKLKSNAFLAQAVKDDKILIYTKAQKLFIFRPSEKRLVDATTININSTASPSPTATR